MIGSSRPSPSCPLSPGVDPPSFKSHPLLGNPNRSGERESCRPKARSASGKRIGGGSLEPGARPGAAILENSKLRSSSEPQLWVGAPGGLCFGGQGARRLTADAACLEPGRVSRTRRRVPAKEIWVDSAIAKHLGGQEAQQQSRHCMTAEVLQAQRRIDSGCASRIDGRPEQAPAPGSLQLNGCGRGKLKSGSFGQVTCEGCDFEGSKSVRCPVEAPAVFPPAGAVRCSVGHFSPAEGNAALPSVSGTNLPKPSRVPQHLGAATKHDRIADGICPRCDVPLHNVTADTGDECLRPESPIAGRLNGNEVIETLSVGPDR